MQNTFKAFDKNKDGIIDRSEIISALHSQGHRSITEDDITQLLSDVDLNKDGVIQFSEYVKMMKKVYNEDSSTTISQKTDKKGANVFKVGAGASSSAFSTFSEEERSAYVRVINTVLKNDADCEKYLPINPDSMDVFSVMKDGIILCKLINIANKGTIDERSINKKQNMNIYQMTVNLILKIYLI
jgi:hypothetical protein